MTHADDDITTIEGLANDNDLQPMQATLMRHNGLQCGCCTPQICSAPAPSDQSIGADPVG
jgi:xanthine dehydrogenase YagT iron-sulfur-binding subunit